MRLRTVRAAVALALLLALALGNGSSAVAAQEPVLSPLPPASAAWILVDADTGAVLAANNERELRAPASTIKVLTALLTVQRVPADDLVPISAVAEGMPARKINVKAGQSWQRDDLLHSMMTVSANDAAVALAERVGGGTLDGFVSIAQRAAKRLGLEDDPVINDPAGLDDEFSHDGGTRISARDLAIVARAALAEPLIAETAVTPDFRFTGGDGLPHHVNNHNLFLRLYPGATGLKTGFTELAGRCLIASATRSGRTMLTVLFNAPDSYGSAARLLDQGFATPVEVEAALDHLPAITANATVDPPNATIATESVLQSLPGAVGENRSPWDSPVVAAVVLVFGLVPLVFVRRKVVARLPAPSAVEAPEPPEDEHPWLPPHPPRPGHPRHHRRTRTAPRA